MTSFDLDLSKYNLGWSDEGVEYAFTPEKGINPGVVEQTGGAPLDQSVTGAGGQFDQHDGETVAAGRMVEQGECSLQAGESFDQQRRAVVVERVRGGHHSGETGTDIGGHRPVDLLGSPVEAGAQGAHPRHWESITFPEFGFRISHFGFFARPHITTL